jgi:succinate dehydrogenase / fumarate reductase membrane anchor subunit
MVVKRVVVGAHYGLGDWLAQRISAVVMVLYTLFLLAVFATRRGPMD